MKTLQHIFLFIICMVFIAFLIGFLLPRKVHIVRNLQINTSSKSIFEQVNVIRNWPKWCSWMQIDSTVALHYSGPVSGVGATCSWLSENKKVGKGRVVIIKSCPFDSLMIIIDTEKGNSALKFSFENDNKYAIATLSFDSDLGLNPVSRWFGLFSERMIGPDLAKCLLKLGNLTDSQNNSKKYEIIDFEVPARILLTIRDTVSAESITPELGLMYHKITMLLKSRSLSPTGPPMAIFHNYSTSNFDIEAGLPIIASITTIPGINCIEMPAQKTILAKYFGSYDSISGAYSALRSEIQNRGLQISGPPWEAYITDPTLENDTSTWQTNIYFPVK